MAGPALQLFPPPPRARQTSPNKRPPPHVKPPTPEPRMDSTSNAKPTADFHELVIQVNSVPVSPSSTTAPPVAISAPPRAHFANSSTNAPPTWDRAQSPNVMTQEDYYRPQDPRAPSPGASIREEEFRQQDLNRTASPAFSTCDTLVRANSSATRVRSQEVPMRSMFPVYDPNVALNNQPYQPPQVSPTHIARTQISRAPYATDTYVPHSNVRTTTSNASPPPPRPFFTPSHLLDNLWLATNGQEEHAIQSYTLRMHRATAANPTITFGTTPSLPFYSLAQSNLAQGHDVPSIMNELLIQRHHPTQPRVLPIAHLDLIAPPSLDTGMFNPQQETTTLLTSIYPKLAALQALDAAANSPAASHIALADPGAQSPAAKRLAEDVLAGAAQRECCALAWTKDDPQQQANPWAQHIPSEGSYQLHHPTLGTFPIKVEGDCSVINNASTRPVTAIYGHTMSMSPQSLQQKPASISIVNPFVLSPMTPRTNAFTPLPPPPRLDRINRPVSMTPSEMSIGQLPTTTDASADDNILGRLDFANDALTLNLGAMSRFGNPFLVDVITSTLLAVAVAEATRGRKSRNVSQTSFEPPPPSFLLTHQKEDTAKAFKESFVEGFQGFGGKAKGPVSGSSLKKFASSMKSSAGRSSASASFDKEIEMGEWYGQQDKEKESKEEKRARRKEEEQERLPLVTRTIISVLTFVFRSVVFVVKIAIKIVAGVVVMITRNFGKL